MIQILVFENEIKQDAGKTECNTPQYGYIMSCIHLELFGLCPESKPDTECKEIKEFMEKCPKRKPPLRDNKQTAAANVTSDRLGEAMKDVVTKDVKEASIVEWPFVYPAVHKTSSLNKVT